MSNDPDILRHVNRLTDHMSRTVCEQIESGLRGRLHAIAESLGTDTDTVADLIHKVQRKDATLQAIARDLDEALADARNGSGDYLLAMELAAGKARAAITKATD